MKRIISFFLFLALMETLVPAQAKADELESALNELPASFRQRANDARLHYNCDWVIGVADTLEQYAEEKDDQRYLLLAAMLRSHNAFINNDSTRFFTNNDIALTLAEKYKLYDRYFAEATNRCSFLLNTEHYYSAKKFSRYLVSKAKEKKYPMGIFFGFHSLGNLYEKLGMYQSSLEAFEDAEKSIEDLGEKYDAYRRYCRQDIAFDYFYLGDYDHAEILCRELIEEDSHDVRSLGVLGGVYFKRGEKSKFMDCFNKVDTMDISTLSSPESYKYIKTNLEVMRLAFDGKIEEALKLAETRPFLECQNRKLDVNIYANRWQEAYHCKEQLYAYYDSLKVAGNENDMREIYAELDNIYQVSQKEGQIARLMYHVTIGFLLFVVIFVVCIYIIRRNYIISNKNKALAANLDQLVEYKKLVMENMEDKMKQAKEAEANESEDDAAPSSTIATGAKAKVTYDDVTRYMYEIASRKLFTNPDFDKNGLLMELNIHRSNFFVDFERQVGCSITKYILKLRMEHAAVLIKDNPDYTLEAIAEECGISSRTTFYRNFTNYFGITPSAYRSEHGID